MKSQFAAQLQDGDHVNDYFLATRKDLRTMNNGGKFLGLVFKDKTGDIGGIMWNNAVSAARLFELGDIVKVRGTVNTYQDRLQIRVESVLPMKEGEYDSEDLVFTPEDCREVWDKLRTMLDSIADPDLKRLVSVFVEDDAFVARFNAAAAGKRWHHAYPGGLAKHCYEMAEIVETMCRLFPDANRDILLAAVFLHDLGKLEEMSHDMFVEYTTAGKLIGHIQIAADRIQREIGRIPDFPERLRLQLLHCVLSHHGELVNGSPVVPKTLEAIILHLADNLDAQADAFVRVVGETREKGQVWSEYLPLIERQIWTQDE